MTDLLSMLDRFEQATKDTLEALKAAEPVIDTSLSYYGTDAAVDALRVVRAAIAKAEALSNG